MRPLVSVIVPTISGREEHLERCVSAYRAYAPGSYELELVVEHGHPSCGAGWQAGMEKASGEYFHLSDDDIEPWLGWAEPAIEAVERGFLPAPQVYGANGQPQSHPQVGRVAPDWTPVVMSALPFFSRRQWDRIGPLFTAHYYCTVPETPVLKADLEWVPAGKLGVGDELVGVDEFPAPGRAHSRRYRRSVVLANEARDLDCVTVYLEDGREVTCSLSHAWLVKGYRSDIRSLDRNGRSMGWVCASRLRPGDRIVSPLRTWEAETSFEAGWLSGIFDGEGTARRYGSSFSLSVAQNPGAVCDGMQSRLSAMGINYSVYPNSSASRATCVQIRTLRDAMELIGRIRPVRLDAAGLWEGASIRSRESHYGVVAEVRPAGCRQVAALGTSTGTFLANGLVSHNTDDWVTYRGEQAGWKPVLRNGYAFTHHWAQVKRGAGMDEPARMSHDHALFEEAKRRARLGQWTAPWPPNGGLS